MCERPKVHAFLGAPRPSASGARRVRPPRWRRLELTWQEGRLVPAAGEAGNALHILNDDDGATQEEERSHEESTGAWREQPLPRLQEDSRWPAGQPQAQLSLRSRYLSTWTLSQALFLRGIQWAGCAAEAPPQRSQTSAAPSAGTPQLLGPVARPPQGCERLWDARSSPGRAERGGVVLEATSDGVLCSQEAERHVSPPASKSARRCEAAADERVGAFTTLLAQCADAAARYRVLVVVVHPCHLKEIKVKRGAGSLVPLASVVVTDQSGVDTTVLLWRRAALWAAAIAAGDLVFITAESGHLQRRKDTAVHLQQQTAQHGSRQCPHLRHRGSPRGRRLALFSVPLPSRAPAIAAAHAAAPTSGSETPAVRPPVATQGQHAGPRPAARHTRIRQRRMASRGGVLAQVGSGKSRGGERGGGRRPEGGAADVGFSSGLASTLQDAARRRVGRPLPAGQGGRPLGPPRASHDPLERGPASGWRRPPAGPLPKPDGGRRRGDGRGHAPLTTILGRGAGAGAGVVLRLPAFPGRPAAHLGRLLAAFGRPGRAERRRDVFGLRPLRRRAGRRRRGNLRSVLPLPARPRRAPLLQAGRVDGEREEHRAGARAGSRRRCAEDCGCGAR
ncbi:shieldin complex subunit 2 isoform X6 [Vanacampus margaritifer]